MSGRQLYLNNKLVHTDPSFGRLVVEKHFEHTFYVPEAVLKGGHIINVYAHALGFGAHAGEHQFSMSFDGKEYDSFCPAYDFGLKVMKARYSTLLQQEPRIATISNTFMSTTVPINTRNSFDSGLLAIAEPVYSDPSSFISNDEDEEARLIEEDKLMPIQNHELYQQRTKLYPKKQLIAKANIHPFKDMNSTQFAPITPIRPMNHQLPINEQKHLLDYQGSSVPNLLHSPISSSWNRDRSHDVDLVCTLHGSNALIKMSSQRDRASYEISPDTPDLLSRLLLYEQIKFLRHYH